MKRTLTPLALLLGASVLGGCANTDASSPAQQARKAAEAQRLQTALTGYKPGKPQSCIPLRDATGPQSYGDSTLIFAAGRGLLYRTETNGGCASIRHGDALVVKAWGTELCRGDMAHSADLVAGHVGGFCVMGDFVPYRKG